MWPPALTSSWPCWPGTCISSLIFYFLLSVFFSDPNHCLFYFPVFYISVLSFSFLAYFNVSFSSVSFFNVSLSFRSFLIYILSLLSRCFVPLFMSITVLSVTYAFSFCPFYPLDIFLILSLYVFLSYSFCNLSFYLLFWPFIYSLVLSFISVLSFLSSPLSCPFIFYFSVLSLFYSYCFLVFWTFQSLSVKSWQKIQERWELVSLFYCSASSLLSVSSIFLSRCFLIFLDSERHDQICWQTIITLSPSWWVRQIKEVKDGNSSSGGWISLKPERFGLKITGCLPGK